MSLLMACIFLNGKSLLDLEAFFRLPDLRNERGLQNLRIAFRACSQELYRKLFPQ